MPPSLRERDAREELRHVRAIGRHTFGHTYRPWLDETGAPMEVQQELRECASIQMMNVYGQAMSSSKREANGKVIELVLKPLKASA